MNRNYHWEHCFIYDSYLSVILTLKQHLINRPALFIMILNLSIAVNSTASMILSMVPEYFYHFMLPSPSPSNSPAFSASFGSVCCILYFFNHTAHLHFSFLPGAKNNQGNNRYPIPITRGKKLVPKYTYSKCGPTSSKPFLCI